jgi:hypothetical protein
MIRRTITLDDTLDGGKPAWLLISQVEHARISGDLARRWLEPFTHEVVDAITHHDDGWAAWEAAPQLDVDRGRPLAFTEMAVADAIVIWDGSIAAARRVGPLAGAIVAGHFIGLASGSEHASRQPAKDWLDRTADERQQSLAEWQRTDASHTPDVAEQAQQMLLTADLLSLWLCMDGPITSGGDASVPNSEMQSRSSTILGKYRFVPHGISVDAAEINWKGSLTPWTFAIAELDLESSALAVPASHYQSWREIAAVGRPFRLRWRLRQTLPPAGEC